MQFWRRAATVVLLAGIEGFGQSHPIRLRTRTIEAGAAESVASKAISSADRRHILIQFAGAEAEPETLQRMRDRGIRVLGRIPDHTLLISAPAAENLDGLGVTWTGDIAPEDKVHPAAITSAEALYLVFEFFRDVDPNAARELLLNAGVLLRDHPDLHPWQILGLTDRDTAMQIARDESVAFVFPASKELIDGIPAIPCDGAILDGDAPAPLIAGVGDGWDGPGKNAATLTYSFGPLTRKLGADVVKATIQSALAEWAKYAKLTFSESSNRSAKRNIDVLFGTGAHGDPYPFDGRGGVLAHTFYPAPPNGESMAGDLHIDDEEPWDGAIDLYSVVLHELGHALGLAHTGDPTAVMYPYYRQVTQLALDDILSIQQMYAAQDGSSAAAPFELSIDPIDSAALATLTTLGLKGHATGGQDPVSIAWSTDAGAFGAARGARVWNIPVIPLIPGPNHITVTATDGTGARATQSLNATQGQPAGGGSTPAAAPPSLSISEPASGSTVAGPSVRVRGTASHPSGIASVAWRNVKTGAGGQAAGTSVWDAAMVPLQVGVNEIAVDVKASDGSTASRSTIVTMAAPQQTGPDTAAPSLTISSPVGSSVTTSAAQIAMSGTARDNVAVASVTWSAAGQTGLATGTSAWSATVPLLTGINNVIIRATDLAGNSSWRSVSVTRR